METQRNEQGQPTAPARIDWLDMAKGYGIILVVIGHYFLPMVTVLIYMFHIPMFFFLSGFVFSTKRNQAGEFLKNKVRRMLVPYACLCLPMALANLYYAEGLAAGWGDLWRELMMFLTQQRYTTLWFLSALLVMNLLLFPVVAYCRDRRVRLGLVVALGVVGLTLWRTGVQSCVWNADMALVALPYFYAGFAFRSYYKTHEQTVRRTGTGVALLLLLLMTLLGMVNYRLTWHRADLFLSDYRVEPLTYLVAFLGIMAMVLLSMKKDIAAIRYIGRNSLLYFAWHQTVVMPMIPRLYWKLGLFQDWPEGAAQVVVVVCSVVLVLAVLTVLNELISRTRLRFMLGK